MIEASTAAGAAAAMSVADHALGAASATAAAPSASTSTASGARDPATASMPGLLQRIKNIMIKPKIEWQIIAPEATSPAQLYVGYVMPLAALAALLSFVRMSLIGVSLPFNGVIRTPIGSGLVYALLAFGFGLVGLFLLALIINALAPTFSGVRDQRQALKVAAYSLTPAWLASLLALSPVLPTLLQFVAGCYGIYVLYLGLPTMMQAPREKAVGYTATVVICTIGLGILFGVLSATTGYFGHRGLMGASPAEQAAQQAAARDQGAAAVGNILGGVLGTDEKGKAGLGAALANLAKAGEQSAAQSAAANVPAAGNAASNSNAATSGSSDSAQSPLSAAGGLATALGGALGGSRRVDVVDFKTLTAMLPASLPGMKRTDARGENQGAVGVKTSSASGSYQGDNGASVHIEISDMSGVSGLMDLAGALVQNTTSESDSGFERDQTLDGRTVHEKYDAKARKGEASVMLAKRFQVEVTGDGVDMRALEQSLSKIDLARLESMKDQGGQAK
ncbi:MAG: Yip1 family protein [Gammaproteobacteria bacterium]